MMIPARRLAVRAGIPVLLLVLLAVWRPWTIQPLDQPRQQAFDASSYVDAAWPRVLAEAESSAVDVAAAARPSGSPAPGAVPGSRRALFVKGKGTVTAVDLRSRVGVARVRVEGLAPPGEIAMQVGPVLRGTAVRDATSFVRFTDFANQSDFAAVSNALNDRVLRAVLAPIDAGILSGQVVTFTGAATVPPGGAGSAIEITPLVLRVAGGSR